MAKENLLYKRAKVARPLEDMGASATHPTYTQQLQARQEDRINELEEMRKKNQQRSIMGAIELAKNSASSSSDSTNQVNAGDNRTTVQPTYKPLQQSTNSEYTDRLLQQYQQMNEQYHTARKQLNFSKAKDTKKYMDEIQNELNKQGYYAKNISEATGIKESKIPQANVSEKDSLKHAEELLNNYNSEQLNKLNDYVNSKDIDESQTFMGALLNTIVAPGAGQSNYSEADKQRNAMQQIKNQIIDETGISEDAFNNLVAAKAQLSHKEAYDTMNTKIKNSSGLAKTGLTVAEIGTYPIASAMGVADRVVNDKPSDPLLSRDRHNFYTALNDIGQSTENAVIEDAENIENPFLREAAKTGYRVTVASGKSLETAAMGDVGLLFFGASAYTEGVKDGEERGLTDAQAQVYGIVSGLTEMATEKIPQTHLRGLLLGDIANEAAEKEFKFALKEIAIQMIEEGNEEGINDIVNLIADSIISGDKSEIKMAYQKYIEDGMSENDALWQVVKDKAAEIGYDYALGALSGGQSAGIAVAGRNVVDAYKGRDIVKQQDFDDSASQNYVSSNMEDYETEEQYNQAQQIRKDIIAAADKARVSGKEARNIYRGVQQSQSNRYNTEVNKLKASMEDAQIRDQVELAKETKSEYNLPAKTRDEIIEDIEFASTPYELAKAIEYADSNDDALNELIEAKKQEIAMYNNKAEDVDNAITPKKAFEMGQRGEELSEDQLNAIPEAERQKVLELNNQAYNKQVLAENPNAVSDTSTGKFFVPAEVKTDGEQIIVVDTEGVEHTNISSPKINAAERAYTEVSRNANTGKLTNKSLFNTTVADAAAATELAINSVNATSAQVNLAVGKILYNASIGNMSWNTFAQKNKFMLGVIDTESAKKLFETVQNESKKADTWKKESGTVKKEGKVSETIEKSLAEESPEMLHLLQAVAKKTNIDIHAFTNDTENRGQYAPEKGVISLNTKFIDEAWFTTNHELGEMAQRYYAEGMQGVQNAILDFLQETLGDAQFNSLINEYQSVYRTGTEGNEANKSRREAANEMVNDCLPYLFSSKDGLKDFTDWVTDNRTASEQVSIFGKIKEFFDRILEYINNAIKGSKLNSAESAMLQMDKKTAEALRKQVTAVYDQALANRDAEVGKTQNNNGARHYTRNSIKVDSTGRELSEGQQEYFADSKVVDENGNLLVVYHGTEEEFYEFKPVEKGGKNGRAEGYGLYFAANQEITKAYGNRQLKGYLNITKPAYSWEKTIKPAELAKLIEATCKVEAERMLDDGYESIEEALKDTWVSNTVYTYDKSMKEAYLEAAKEYIKLNSNDMDIIITVMNDNGVQSYEDAYDFYAILKDTLGFDGYITKWTTADGSEENTVYVAFDSNQFKNTDNENPTDSPDIRHSFAGIKSKSADLDAMNEAMALKEEGLDDLSILARTGWFLGMDNIWKYEIPDNDLEIFKSGNRAFVESNPDFARYMSLMNKIIFSDSAYTQDEYDEMMKLDEKISDDDYYKTAKTGKLIDFIKHDELFKAYPWLENTNVYFVELPKDTRGAAGTHDNSLLLNEKFQTEVAWNEDILKSTILHEIQHLIQENEGFAPGSSPEWWADIKDSRIERDKKNLEGVLEYLNKNIEYAKANGQPTSTDEFVEQSIKKVADKNNNYSMEDHWEALDNWKKTSLYHYEHLKNMLERHIERMVSDSNEILYLNTAGEIEARDVSDRKNYSKEDRLKVYPNQASTRVVYPKGTLMDRRYSKRVDSEGNQLTEGQKEFFKNSKVVNAYGELMVLYHGSEQPGFTTFGNPKNWFTSNRENAATYAGSNNNIILDNVKSLERLNELIENTDLTVKKENGKYVVYQQGFIDSKNEGDYKTLKETIDKVNELLSEFEEGRIYESYINLVNPLEVDANSNEWDSIEYDGNTYETYELADYAKKNGYDGLIIRNVNDPGPYSEYAEDDTESDIVVAFNPNQIKSVDNPNPTDNDDIRYSIKVDDDRVYNYRGIEIVKNPTDREYQQMRKDILRERPWLRPDEPLLRRTFDENGNEYYWEALAAMHRTIEPAIREHWGVRVAQNYNWWLDEDDKYFWPSYYEERYSKKISDRASNSFKVYGEASPYADSLNESKVVSTMLGTMNAALAKADAFELDFKTYNNIERYIANKYNANLPEGELAANIAYAFAYMQKNKLDTDYESMMNYLLNIGDEVIANSNMKDPLSVEIYEKVKAAIKGINFKLSDQELAEIKSAFGGDWKAAFGTLNKAGIKLNNEKGISVDQMFSQIRDEVLKIAGVDIEYADKPSEQLLAIMDTIQALEPTAYLWDGANDMDKALTVVADIVDQYYTYATEQLESNIVKNTDKGKKKVADAVKKEKAKLKEQVNAYKQKQSEAFNEVVAEKNRIIQQQQNQLRAQQEQLKKWNADNSEKEIEKVKRLTEAQMRKTARIQAQQAVQSYKDRQERAKQIENIKKTGIRLINWLDHPTDNQHVPAFLQKPLAEFLSAIDFLPKNAKADSKSTLTWQQRMQSLREALRKIKDAEAEGENSAEGYFAQNIVAKELLAMMDDFLGAETWDEFTQSYIVTKRAAAKVSTLPANELQTLNKIMSALSASINNMNKTYANSVFKHISDMSRESAKEIDALPEKKDMQKFFGKAFNFLNFDELEPITWFEGLGSGAKSVFDELRDGFNLKTKHVRESDEYMAKAKAELGISDKELSKWKTEAHTFKLTEGTVMLNTNQIMSLYEILKRKQGKPHVAVGGIKAADFDYKDGKSTKQHHQAKAVHIRATEAQAIIDTLTDEQKALADKMQQYMATECASWGNRVTQIMYGYKKYEEKDYFPLKTDAHSRATNTSSDNNVSYYTIKNQSFTKAITPMANNAVVIDDIFDVFTDHVVSMADYDAYVLPIADAMRWFNYSERMINAVAPDELNEAGARVDYIGNMQESIDRVYGDAGLSYFKQFIKDINGDYAGRSGKSEMLSSLMSMYKAQAVGANVRVVIQQPTAVVRAADVIEPKYLLKATVSLPNAMKYAKKAQQNSEIAYWKAQGYYETYLGQSFKEIITGDTTLKDRITDASGKLAGLADDLSWGIMYHAAELKVKATQPQLAEGTAEFDAAATKIFEDIVDHTQVVDTIFHKSQWMRNQDLGHKMTSAFMAEPTKTYNMLYRAYRDVKYSGDKKYKIKRLKDVALIFLFEQMLNAIVTAAWDSLRDDEKESYLDGLKTAFKENAIDNVMLLNLIPIAKDIISFFKGYDSTSYIYDGMENLVQTLLTDQKYAMNLIKGNQKKQSKTVYGIIYKNAQAISQISGVPFANVMRDVKSIYNTVNDAWGGTDVVTTTATAKKNEERRTQNSFSEAYNSEDMTAAKNAMQDIYNKAIESGKDESEAWGNVRDVMKAEFQAQIEAHPDDKAAIVNRFKSLLGYTQKADGKGGYRPLTDKEIQNTYINKWLGEE